VSARRRRGIHVARASARHPPVAGRAFAGARCWLASVVCASAVVFSAPAVAADAPTGAGQQVYEKWCEPCHAPGSQYPGTVALAALYKGSKPAVLVERTDLTPPVVKQFVRKGVSVMPFFRKTEISDAELDALAAWLSRQKQ
jgi:mono/diheme cytochrome c family protein